MDTRATLTTAVLSVVVSGGKRMTTEQTNDEVAPNASQEIDSRNSIF